MTIASYVLCRICLVLSHVPRVSFLRNLLFSNLQSLRSAFYYVKLNIRALLSITYRPEWYNGYVRIHHENFLPSDLINVPPLMLS